MIIHSNNNLYKTHLYPVYASQPSLPKKQKKDKSKKIEHSTGGVTHNKSKKLSKANLNYLQSLGLNVHKK